MTNDELYDLRIKMRKEGGWAYADGKPADGGYYAARDGGGYETTVTPTPSPTQLVERGTPAYHGTVAWRCAAELARGAA